MLLIGVFKKLDGEDYERDNMEKESTRQVAGKRMRNAGIVIGILGLIAAPELVFPAVALAASGVIFERTGGTSRFNQDKKKA